DILPRFRLKFISLCAGADEACYDFYDAATVMKFLVQVILFVSLFYLASCTKDAQQGGDPSGTWVGDFGPAFYDRNTISLELQWNGHDLTGTIRPGTPEGRMYRNFADYSI